MYCDKREYEKQINELLNVKMTDDMAKKMIELGYENPKDITKDLLEIKKRIVEG